MDEKLTLLGGITPSVFLKEYWQKKPLLIRQAIPNFKGLLEANDLAGLACEEEVQSRIVINEGDNWRLEDGPFDDDTFANLPEKDWTLLVQSVNHFLPEASELLKKFNFIPQARLDDLMVSYAPEGGSVGPHFDSYDVFLLQGQGSRLWKVSEQTDLSIVEGAPLRILKNFETAQEWLLEAGDMLYLPPKLAHWGVAQSSSDDTCMTYSIGFRAPKKQELATEFLHYLHHKLDTNELQGMYTDTDLTLQDNSAEISDDMIKKVSDHLREITWNDSDVATFIGEYTTEPKPDVFFEENEALSLDDFIAQVVTQGLCLDLKTQLLFQGSQFFINGQVLVVDDQHGAELVKTLAHDRALPAEAIQQNQEALSAITKHLHALYSAGFCHLIDGEEGYEADE